jgi:uncharacterized protein (DUF58 family)
MAMTRAVPGRTAIAALGALGAAVLLALLARVPVPAAARVTIAAAAALAGAAVVDYVLSVRAWRASSPVLRRQLPAAFAIGVKRPVPLAIEAQGARTWRCELHDHADATLVADGMPVRLDVRGGQSVETTYSVTPTLRGEIAFAPADVRVRSRWGFWDLLERPAYRRRRVFRFRPGGALRVAGGRSPAAGNRREDAPSCAGRAPTSSSCRSTSSATPAAAHRLARDAPAREAHRPRIQDEARSVRAAARGLAGACARTIARRRPARRHFDQVLNAVMLLSYVALQQGDAVGAMTFGTPPGGERAFAPRKGTQALNLLMGQLYDVQPTLTHSDYVAAARMLLQRQRKRALVIVITNFRDEDSAELSHALRLLRRRHLVLLASLRERIVGELIGQPLAGGDASIDVAAAHLYEQARRDAFNRLATRDALMADAEPDRLGVELVNRYHPVKRAGLI